MTSEKHLGLELRVPMARNLIQLVTNVIFEQHNHYLNKKRTSKSLELPKK